MRPRNDLELEHFVITAGLCVAILMLALIVLVTPR